MDLEDNGLDTRYGLRNSPSLPLLLVTNSCGMGRHNNACCMKLPTFVLRKLHIRDRVTLHLGLYLQFSFSIYVRNFKL
jgi:hypothetical protein